MRVTLLARLLGPYLAAIVAVAAVVTVYSGHQVERLRPDASAIAAPELEAARGRIRTAFLAGIAAVALLGFWPALTLTRRLSRSVERLGEFAAGLLRGEAPPPPRPETDGAAGRIGADIAAIVCGLGDQLRAAREERQRLEAVLGGMVEGVLVLDAAGTVVLDNRRVPELLQLAPGESCRGRALIEVVRHPELHDLVRRLTRAEPGAAPLSRKLVFDGARRRVLQVSATSIAEGPGPPDAFILVCHDITDLERLEETRRDFVANVSHELRTPLAAIRGYSETLRHGALDDRENAARFLGIIERHAERLGRLVDDLLTLSDLELGRVALHKREVQAANVIETACELLRSKAEQGSVRVRKEVSPDLPPFAADPDRIVQVLVNLIDNAIKFTPAGGQVCVSARAVAAAETPDAVAAPAVEIAVADTGVGVPSDDLPRLTERFYRVDRARSREVGGTGLGLAIVKHVVQAHGGALRIESTVGKGTTVRVFLPAVASLRPGG